MKESSQRKKTRLTEYERKRSPSLTNEPFSDDSPRDDGRTSTLSGAYVVHLHDATRRHYDLRLEVGGVLASFAVPRGPSLDPDEKCLAVKTEDHPIEYLEFEDVIPEKQYGAGPMIAWDRGTVEYLEGPAEEEIPRGKLDLMLRGMKLRGRFALVKLKKSEKGDEWILFKKKDEHSSKERKIIEELPRSVFSGLTVEELEKRAAIADEWLRDARAIASKKRSKAKSSGMLFDADLGGVRVVASRDGDVVTLRGSSGNVEAFYPDVVRALRALPLADFTLDGELVAFDANGHPSAKLLGERASRMSQSPLRAVTSTPVVLVATDLMRAGDIALADAPLEDRRALLTKMLPPLGFLRAAPPLEGPQDRVLATVASLGLPGIVAKKRGSRHGDGWEYVATGIEKPRVTITHEMKREVKVSNRDKIFWPDEGLTKGDLVDYYSAISGTILPFLVDRPVILVRYPDGINGKSFYQWNVPPGMPPWVRTMNIKDDNDEQKRGFLIDDPSTLVYIANLASIPVHILASRLPDLTQADFFTIDFDIKQSEFRHAITLATTLHELLDEIDLPGFPKTSGKSGLHVLVPLGAGQSFGTAVALADLLGKLLVERHPDIATMERVVKRRGPKVYVDTGQTGETRAIVAPYSVREVAGARVSTPLEWSEVTQKLDPTRFTIKTVPARIAKRGDPMRDLLRTNPDVPRAVQRLSELVSSSR